MSLLRTLPEDINLITTSIHTTGGFLSLPVEIKRFAHKSLLPVAFAADILDLVQHIISDMNRRVKIAR